MLERKEIPIEKIKVGEYAQRLSIEDESLDGLVASIGRVGLVYPVVVCPEGDAYLLVEGHRRLAAHKRMGRSEIMCVVTGSGKSVTAEIAFAGNFFRKDLSPVELASAIRDCHKQGTMTVQEMAVGFNRSEHWVNRMIAICDWPDDVLEAVHQKVISIAAASNLALVTDEVYRAFLVENAVEQGATARTTSAWLQSFRNMAPQEEAVQAEPTAGQAVPVALIPQAPCFCCSQVFPMNEMSHVPLCGPCVKIMRNVSAQQA